MAVAVPQKEIPIASPEMLEAQFGLPAPERTADGEHYGLSLSCIKAAGAVALEGALGLESGAVRQLRDEFNAGVFEGLSSDSEFGDGLRVTKFDAWKIAGGKVRSADGETAVSDLVGRGYETSTRAAKKDFRMATQAHRDRNDLANALEVDEMVSGNRDYNTRIVVSAAPKEAMRRDGEDYWYNKGYVKDLHYIQMYHYNGRELVTAALSFKSKNIAKICQTLRDQGVEIPEGISADDIINHALTFSAGEEEAKATAKSLRKEAGDGTGTNTVGMVEDRQSMDTAFNEMYLPIAVSSAAGKKTERTAEIVSVFLGNSQYFSEEVRAQLASMNIRQDFTDSDTRLLHQLSIYAAIERVRGELGGAAAYLKHNTMPSYDYAPSAAQAAAAGFIARMGEYVQIGSSAGRTYSSCGAALKLVNEALKEFEIPSLQDIFGGKAKEKEEDSDDKGSLYFLCENRHLNRRPYGRTIECCATCGVSVAC